MTLVAILVFAAGTYGIRVAGPLLRERIELSDRVRRVLATAATALLLALVATSALTEGQGFAGWARPAGVVAGGALAWFRVPFVLVVIAAAGTTACLRLIGIP